MSWYDNKTNHWITNWRDCIPLYLVLCIGVFVCMVLLGSDVFLEEQWPLQRVGSDPALLILHNRASVMKKKNPTVRTLKQLFIQQGVKELIHSLYSGEINHLVKKSQIPYLSFTAILNKPVCFPWTDRSLCIFKNYSTLWSNSYLSISC